MKALLIVDVQNDFCPGGALPAPQGDTIIPVINDIMNKFDVVIASKDWHPNDSKHFKKWPAHCIANTNGAEFHPELNEAKINQVLLKGTKNEDDGYSAFEATNINLNQFLTDKQISDIFIAGLTTEYCIKNTAKDSIQNGYLTYVIKDAIAPVKPNSRKEKKALKTMSNKGALIIDSKQIDIL